MPPKGKKSKAEEALAFLDDLDNLEAPVSGLEPDPCPTPAAAPAAAPAIAPAAVAAVAASGSTPRVSTESSRGPRSSTTTAPPSFIAPSVPDASSAESKAPAGAEGAGDDEADAALAFLEQQIKQKRAPLTVPLPTSRSTTPATLPVADEASSTAPPVSIPTTTSASSGWGVSSLWSSATSALQSAQRVADKQYKKVRTEGVAGVTGHLEGLSVGGVDLAKLRKEAEERLGGIVKGVDLDKLRQDILTQAGSTLSTIINTVAPPISAHETIELWFSHPMTGYGGVEGVVYRSWLRILDQTESGELVLVWSAPVYPEGVTAPTERGINPVKGWDAAWEATSVEMVALRSREDNNPQGRARPPNPTVPVTTIPVFLQLQPVLAPLSVPEPPLLLSTPASVSAEPKNHLHFIVTLQDPAHSLRFVTTSQPAPADWLDVEYDRSDWVEERLVDIIRTAVETVAQDYVSTRMGLKPSAVTLVPVASESQGNEAQTTGEMKEETQNEASA